MRLIKWLLVLAIFFGIQIYGIQFATKNTQTVNLVVPFGRETGEVELWQLVFITAGIGAALALLVFLVELVGLQAAKQRLSRRVKQLERELTAMRNLPLSEKAPPDRPRAEELEPTPAGRPGDVSSI